MISHHGYVNWSNISILFHKIYNFQLYDDSMIFSRMDDEVVKDLKSGIPFSYYTNHYLLRPGISLLYKYHFQHSRPILLFKGVFAEKKQKVGLSHDVLAGF